MIHIKLNQKYVRCISVGEKITVKDVVELRDWHCSNLCSEATNCINHKYKR